MDYNGTVNEIYDAFMRTLSDICDDDLPLREYNLKEKDIKSSKKKQRLCIKFLQTKTLEGEFKCKTYKSIFEKIGKKRK